MNLWKIYEAKRDLIPLECFSARTKAARRTKLIGTLRKDNENVDVNPKGLGRDVAVVVDVVGHFYLTV